MTEIHVIVQDSTVHMRVAIITIDERVEAAEHNLKYVWTFIVIQFSNVDPPNCLL